MGFFEDSYITAKEAFDAVGRKGSELVETQKLKINIARLNAQITKDFETLGRLAYDSAKNGTNIDDVHAAIVMAIEEKYQEIERIQAKLAQARGLLYCPKCGATNPPESQFCNRCGSNLGAQEKESDAESDQGEDAQA